ncbi:MAG: hypothetical protein IPM29_04210 [Planctomycetes bacterium]|nr:hypothetical protein [Planctomycetota bacterium]
MLIPIAVLLSLLACALPGQTIVHISPTGSDVTGDGSASSPFRTVQRGLDVVSTGGLVRVLPGDYPQPLTVSRSVTIEGFGGRPRLGPLATPGVIALILAADVTLRELRFDGGGGSQLGVRVSSPADRTTIRACEFARLGVGGAEIVVAGGSSYTVEDCRFEAIRNATADAVALAANGASGLSLARNRLTGGDLGVRLQSCPAPELADCTFEDLHQAALLAIACANLDAIRCRATRCAQLPRPSLLSSPPDQLGALSLSGGTDAAHLREVVVEQCGGFLGFDTFRSGASQRFDGLFGIGVGDSHGVVIERCTIRDNEFGGVYAIGPAGGPQLVDSNLVGNGARNRSAPDVAVFTDGPPVTATGCFWGLAQGPANDGAGPGNGIAGHGVVTVASPAPLPHIAPAFRFSLDATLPIGGPARAIACADVDSDGRDGLVAVLGNPGRIVVLRRDATGFRPPVTLAIGGDPVAIAVGKLDAGETVDLAVCDQAQDRVLLLFGDGKGGFPGMQSIAVPRRPVAITAGYLDDRSGTDLCVASQGDVFRAGGITVIATDGAGAILPFALPGAVAPSDVAWLDVDGQRGDDLAAYDVDPAQPGLRLWRSRNDGGFDPAVTVFGDPAPVSDARLEPIHLGGQPASLAVGTFALVPALTGQLRLLRNDGAGHLLAPEPLGATSGPFHLAAGRFGLRPDAGLAFSKPGDGRVVVFGDLLAAGPPGAPHQELVFERTYPGAIAVGDFDGDRADDLAIHDSVLGTVEIWHGRREPALSTYGSGCAGVGPVPSIRARATPLLGARTFGIGMVDAPANAPSFLLIDVAPQDWNVFGACRLLVLNPFALGTLADGVGDADLEIGVPVIRALVGGELYCQWWAIDPLLSGLLSLRSSNGLRLRVGG